MDRINEAVKDFIARHGGNKTVIAKKLGGVVTPQALGRYERGEREPGIDFFKAVLVHYGEDLAGLNQMVPRENAEVVKIVSAFEKAMDNFRHTFDTVVAQNNASIAGLNKDKEAAFDRELWYRRQLDELSVSLKALKQA